MTTEIKCPKCGTSIQIGEDTYQSIASQVRDTEFHAAVRNAQEQMNRESQLQVQNAIANTEIKMTKELAAKDAEIQRLSKKVSETVTAANQHIYAAKVAAEKVEQEKVRLSTALEEERTYHKSMTEKAVSEAIASVEALQAKKDLKIAELEKSLSNSESSHQLALGKAVSSYQLEIARLKKDLENNHQVQESLISSAVSKEHQHVLAKEAEVSALKEKLNTKQKELDFSLKQTATEYEKTISDLRSEIASKETSHIRETEATKEGYERLLKAKDDELEYYKEYRRKQTVKLLGESLEEHCKNSFEMNLRPLLPHCVFEKDNTVAEGSKGDFIFKDFDGSDEYISIMFDMKTEASDSVNKHTNESHLKKLDKDRQNKHCEYAVLVSTLEPDSDLYNTGIVDMSHLYPKTYVVRPAFFTAIITLLSNAAKGSLSYRRELTTLKAQSVDVSTFESNLSEYKASITKTITFAAKSKDTAIKNIDKVISTLQQIRDNLTTMDRHMQAVEKKSEELTIKKLTKTTPAVAEMFEDLHNTLPAAS